MNKLNLLLKSNENLYHTQDLALLWGVRNRNTLYTTIKITKGLYSTIPINEINKYKLGTSLIHRFCYVSCETALAEYGVINQAVYPITFVSSISLKIDFDKSQYLYRQLKAEMLYNPDGVIEKEGYFVATRERAMSDMLYFNPKYYFDNL